MQRVNDDFGSDLQACSANGQHAQVWGGGVLVFKVLASPAYNGAIINRIKMHKVRIIFLACMRRLFVLLYSSILKVASVTKRSG